MNDRKNIKKSVLNVPIMLSFLCHSCPVWFFSSSCSSCSSFLVSRHRQQRWSRYDSSHHTEEADLLQEKLLFLPVLSVSSVCLPCLSLILIFFYSLGFIFHFRIDFFPSFFFPVSSTVALPIYLFIYLFISFLFSFTNNSFSCLTNVKIRISNVFVGLPLKFFFEQSRHLKPTPEK